MKKKPKQQNKMQGNIVDFEIAPDEPEDEGMDDSLKSQLIFSLCLI